jgi:hypothetical protein
MKKETIQELCEELQVAVTEAYESGVTMERAEAMAARMLGAQLTIAAALATADLNARMRKNGVKAIKASVYMQEIARYDKKPSEGFLEQAVNAEKLVTDEADAYEKADATKEELQSYFGIFKDAHIYFRGIAKGSFA